MEYLKKLGFIPVAYPSESIAPLQLLIRTKKNVVEQTNALITDLFLPYQVTPPPVKQNQAGINEVSFTEKFGLNFDSNFSLLNNLLASLKSNISYDLNSNVTVEFVKPVRCFINILQLDSFVSKSNLNTEAKTTLNYLKDNDVFIITEALKVKEFLIEIDRTDHTSINASIKDVSNQFELGTKAEGGKDKVSQMVYKGNKRITVAIKACQILYEKSFWNRNQLPTFRIIQYDKAIVYKSEHKHQVDMLDADLIYDKNTFYEQ